MHAWCGARVRAALGRARAGPSRARDEFVTFRASYGSLARGAARVRRAQVGMPIAGGA